MSATERPEVRRGQVAIGVVLMAFGFLAILTIGMPFFVIGALLFVSGLTDAQRRSPTVFWPLLASLPTFFLVYVLVAPLSCTSWAIEELTSDGRAAADSGARCSNLIGIDYSGGTSYNPPLWPAVLAAIAAAGVAGVVTHRVVRTRTASV